MEIFKSAPRQWRPNVMTIKESKDLSTLPLDELIDNLKVYESEDEEHSMAVRDFKKFFRRRGKFVCQPHDDKKNFQKIKEDKKEKEYRSKEESKKEEICLMALDNNEVRLKVKLEPDVWIKDSGCSRHMAGNKDLFSSYKAIDGGNVVFRSNTKSKIIGKGQICDKKYKVLFSNTGSEILKDDITIDDTLTLWHRRLGHANMRLIQSLSSKELVRNLPKLKYESHFCDACNIEKQNPKMSKKPYKTKVGTMAMQEELNQFKTNDVWNLVPPPDNQTIIGIDFDETYAHVARLESIRILHAYACAHDFNLFQIDVKSAFLNGFINEEVYVAQPPSFVDFEKPNHVFKLKKPLYGLKQAPKAWYNRLKAFLHDHMYNMGLVDNTLFTKKKDSHIIIV
nr:copia protein [Tanacetum cinerariifolium]